MAAIPQSSLLFGSRPTGMHGKHLLNLLTLSTKGFARGALHIELTHTSITGEELTPRELERGVARLAAIRTVCARRHAQLPSEDRFGLEEVAPLHQVGEMRGREHRELVSVAVDGARDGEVGAEGDFAPLSWPCAAMRWPKSIRAESVSPFTSPKRFAPRCDLAEEQLDLINSRETWARLSTMTESSRRTER